jgi:arylsulfatase
MIANIDDNVGRLLAQLQEWGLERDTLMLFMNDNGGTVGVPTFNAGMREGKGTAWLGATRAASFWRWPGTLAPADCPALTAHIDVLPTLAELAGAKLSDKVTRQIEGRSLVPLLENPSTPWPDRLLFTHLGRWPKGANPNDSKFKTCAVRRTRWTLVSDAGARNPQWQLFDVTSDYAQTNDVSAAYPDVVRELATAYETWWKSVQPQLVNENVRGPKINPFKRLYWKQFGGGPDAALLKQMDPTRKPDEPVKKL